MNVCFRVAVFCAAIAHFSLHAQTPVWTQFANSPSNSPTDTVRNDDIYFVDATNGWSARGTDGIYRTTNGGLNWRKVYTNTTSTSHFRSIGLASATRGWAGNLGIGSYDGTVNDTNVLFETFDGENWSPVPNFLNTSMTGFCAMHVLDSQHVYGVGRVRGPAFFTKTEDGGASWSTPTNLTQGGIMGGLMDVYFKDPTNGFIVGMDTNAYNNCVSPYYHGAIARTTNGGLSWFVVTNSGVNCSYFWKMSWPSPNTAYATLQQNGSYSTVIYYKTTDGGATWSSNGIPLSTIGSPASFFLQGIGFVSETEGWMGGSPSSSIAYNLQFIHTTNGGATWTSEGYNNTRSINRIRFLSPTLGFMAGQRLHVYRVPLGFSTQPTNQTANVGASVTFNSTGQGTPPLNYQWRFNGTNISGATTNSYTISSVQTNSAGSYDVLVSDYSGSVTSSTATLSVNGLPVAPNITTQPQSQVVNAGSNATFTVTASGTTPFSYQWRFNGTNISGATLTSYTRTNVQLADVGSYTVVVTNMAGSVTSSVATLSISFNDNFDGYVSPVTIASPATTNGYKILFRAASGAYDFKAIFGFNYSTVTFPTNIPPAPNSTGGTTKGLYLTVNKDATAAAAAVNLYPVGQTFSGNFALKFDLWINWRDINTSTEHALFGINHSGNVTNRVGQSPSDGLFFAVEGEDDSAPNSATLRDFSVFRGGGASAPVLMTTNNTTFGPAPLLGVNFDNGDAGFVSLFPAKTISGFGTTPAGTAGLGWIQTEVRQETNVITWLMNNTLVAQYTNTFAYTNGNILIGYNDHFSSTGDSNNFAIFDNIRVEPLLAAAPALPSGVLVLSPRLSGANFAFEFSTDATTNYAVQRTEDLAVQNWQTYTNIVGNGATNSVLVPLLPGSTNVTQQYYRVIR